MNVTIETFFYPYCDEVTEIYFRLVNTILFSVDENSFRKGINKLKTQVPLDGYFVYGFGPHHFWVHQRKISDPTKYFESRLIKADFNHLKIETMKTKMTVNGVSVCPTGEERHEYFTLSFSSRRKKRLCQYYYHDADGELFSCVAPTLEECRAKRDMWLNKKNNK